MRRRALLQAATGIALPGLAAAHGTRADDLVLDHAYAPPAAAGQAEAPVYLRALRNTGRTADRLLGAESPAARAVVLPQGTVVLPPGAALQPRHSQPPLIVLQQPLAALRDGERFPLRLRFEHAGEVAVEVWVQTPRRP